MITKETISHKKIIEAGFCELEKNKYQKKITDKKGVRFYIHCTHYIHLDNLRTINWWEFTVQLETDKGAVDISTVQWFNDNGVHSQNKIKYVEQYFNWLWELHGRRYYKKYAED